MVVVFRLSFLVLASVAAFSVARINLDRSRKTNSSIKKNDSGFIQEEIEEEEEKDKSEDSNVEAKEKKEVKITIIKSKHDVNLTEHELEYIAHKNKWNNVGEIERLENVKREIGQRRVSLELRLLELNELKEYEFDMAELQKHLKAKRVEIGKLSATIYALEGEIEKLHDEIKQNKWAEKQVEIARKRILEMQAKMRVDAAKMKGQLMMLKEQVNGFYMEETSNIVEAEVGKKLKSMNDVEFEVLEKKRRNKELQLEKRELSTMLAAAQAKITALSNMTERKILVRMEEEMSSLRLVNETLRKQYERLQRNKFSMVEELVYQRWLNTCLRLEAQDYKTPRQSISESLLSKNSSKRTRNRSFDYSFDTISSHESSSESDKITSTTIDSSSTNQTRANKKSSLIQYMKRWGRSRYDTSVASSQGRSSPSKKGLIRRFSMSTVPLKTSMLKTKDENAMQNSETMSFPRKRRVSFNDAIQMMPSAFNNFPVKGDPGEEGKSGKRSQDSGNVSVEWKEEEEKSSSLEFKIVKNNGSRNSSRQEMDSEEMETQVVNKITEIGCKEDLASGVLNVPLSDKEVGNQMVHFLAAFFFLILMLVFCFKLLTGCI